MRGFALANIDRMNLRVRMYKVSCIEHCPLRWQHAMCLASCVARAFTIYINMKAAIDVSVTYVLCTQSMLGQSGDNKIMLFNVSDLLRDISSIG